MVRHKKLTHLRLSQAIEGFFLEARARGLSKCTINDYRNACNKLIAWLDGDDPPIHEIDIETIKKMLDHLGHTPQQPNSRILRYAKPLSNKSLLNIHTGLSALWTWALREDVVEEHIIRQIPRPKPEQRVIIPFTRAEVVKLIKACQVTRGYFQKGVWCTNARKTNLRDQAIIRTLLDTGVRASEICNICIRDVDLENQHIKVFGKGAKERSLPLGNRTTKAIWRYLSHDRPGDLPGEVPLFATDDGLDFLNRRALGSLLKRMGERAGVNNVYPHRFRHTFAITYLRNDGNIYSLQMILGHTTLDMVRRYLAIAQADVENAHRKASPVDNWRL